jgi:hypothetical protein
LNDYRLFGIEMPYADTVLDHLPHIVVYKSDFLLREQDDETALRNDGERLKRGIKD